MSSRPAGPLRFDGLGGPCTQLTVIAFHSVTASAWTGAQALNNNVGMSPDQRRTFVITITPVERLRRRAELMTNCERRPWAAAWEGAWKCSANAYPGTLVAVAGHLPSRNA